MRRNCSLDLRLSPMASPSFARPWATCQQNSTDNHLPTTSQQNITIFYKGRISVCDVTEFQARAIIWLASREMEERINTTSSKKASISLHSQFHSPPGLSLKRSLQRFLQTRKKRRVEATSSYSQ